MATFDQFQNLSANLAEAAQLKWELLSNGVVTRIYNSDTNCELCRLQLYTRPDAEEAEIGIAFPIQAPGTDTAFAYHKAVTFFPDLKLLFVFYFDKLGNFFTGQDAFAHYEQDREDEMRKTIFEEIKLKQINAWEHSKLEKSGGEIH